MGAGLLSRLAAEYALARTSTWERPLPFVRSRFQRLSLRERTR